jgi:hypothetical protein
MVVFAFFAVQLGLFADALRSAVGDSSANIIGALSLAVTLSLGFSIWCWSTNKLRAGLVAGLVALACAFAYGGWFILPDQRYERAIDRVDDLEWALEDLSFQERLRATNGDAQKIEQSTEDLAQVSLRFQRLRTELAARQLELRAAELRFRGDPAYFRSDGLAWFLWIDAAFLLLAAGLIAFIPKTLLREWADDWF